MHVQVAEVEISIPVPLDAGFPILGIRNDPAARVVVPCFLFGARQESCENGKNDKTIDPVAHSLYLDPRHAVRSGELPSAAGIHVTRSKACIR